MGQQTTKAQVPTLADHIAAPLPKDATPFQQDMHGSTVASMASTLAQSTVNRLMSGDANTPGAGGFNQIYGYFTDTPAMAAQRKAAADAANTIAGNHDAVVDYITKNPGQAKLAETDPVKFAAAFASSLPKGQKAVDAARTAAPAGKGPAAAAAAPAAPAPTNPDAVAGQTPQQMALIPGFMKSASSPALTLRGAMALSSMLPNAAPQVRAAEHAAWQVGSIDDQVYQKRNDAVQQALNAGQITAQQAQDAWLKNVMEREQQARAAAQSNMFMNQLAMGLPAVDGTQ